MKQQRCSIVMGARRDLSDEDGMVSREMAGLDLAAEIRQRVVDHGHPLEVAEADFFRRTLKLKEPLCSIIGTMRALFAMQMRSMGG